MQACVFVLLCYCELCVYGCVYVCACVHDTIHWATAITAEFMVITDRTKKMYLLPLSASSLAHTTPFLFTIGFQLQPFPSHWSFCGCCLVTSEADIFEQRSGCSLQHFYRVESETALQTHTLQKTNTYPHRFQRTPRHAHWGYCCSAARPAGTDAHISKCSTGITNPLDTRLTYRPVKYRKRRTLKKRESDSSDRTRLTAGFCSCRRCVKCLTGSKKRKTEIVLSLVKSQGGHSKGKKTGLTAQSSSEPPEKLTYIQGQTGIDTP